MGQKPIYFLLYYCLIHLIFKLENKKGSALSRNQQSEFYEGNIKVSSKLAASLGLDKSVPCSKARSQDNLFNLEGAKFEIVCLGVA